MRERDNELIDVVKEYNNWLREGTHTYMELLNTSAGEVQGRCDCVEDEHRSVVYACLKYTKANEFGALAISDTHLYFYFLNVFRVKWEVVGLSILPLEGITKIKISKFLVWNNVEVSFRGDDGKERRLKYQVSSAVAGLKKQKLNVKVLLSYLRGACG